MEENGRKREFMTLSGKLWKRGQKMKSWKLRIFNLSADSLSYSDDSEKPKGTVSLDMVTRVDITHIFPSRPHTFQIVTPERTLYIDAGTKKELNKWMNATRYNFLLLEEEVVRKESEIIRD